MIYLLIVFNVIVKDDIKIHDLRLHSAKSTCEREASAINQSPNIIKAVCVPFISK